MPLKAARARENCCLSTKNKKISDTNVYFYEVLINMSGEIQGTTTTLNNLVVNIILTFPLWS